MSKYICHIVVHMKTVSNKVQTWSFAPTNVSHFSKEQEPRPSSGCAAMTERYYTYSSVVVCVGITDNLSASLISGGPFFACCRLSV